MRAKAASDSHEAVEATAADVHGVCELLAWVVDDNDRTSRLCRLLFVVFGCGLIVAALIVLIAITVGAARLGKPVILIGGPGLGLAAISIVIKLARWRMLHTAASGSRSRGQIG